MISITQKILGLKNIFAHQGAVVESWRYKNGRKIGPYYRLAYRVAGRQRSIYLGKSQKLLRQVRRLLEKLQRPVKTRRTLRQAQKVFQESMKRHQAQFRIDLLKVGLQLRGYAVRGWRRWRKLLRSQGTPQSPCTGLTRPIPHPPNAESLTTKLPVCHPC
ncbi:MAG: hypothetical protein JXB10_09580 [Pirellulales bacterium]|nr:hypothetical protein [Pirellulales bacterium]